eukprot:7514350-Pyramimonas_sp.AAC.1
MCIRDRRDSAPKIGSPHDAHVDPAEGFGDLGVREQRDNVALPVQQIQGFGSVVGEEVLDVGGHLSGDRARAGADVAVVGQ